MIKITRCNWSDDTPEKLRGACDGWEAITRANVESGKEQLLHFTGENVDVWAVIRVEEVAHGLEMVVCYSGGHGMKAALFALKDMAIKNGFVSARYHTTKPSIYRMYRKYGLCGEEVERVYRVNLGGAHG